MAWARLPAAFCLACLLPAVTALHLAGHNNCPSQALWEHASCEHLGWPRSRRRRRIIDAFGFNGEDSMVEARRGEFGSLVNGTAILTTEANFHGQPHAPVTPPQGDGIEHMMLPQVHFMQCRSNGAMDPKCALSVMKNSIADVVERFNLHPDDWVIFGDPDEIPNREVVRLLHQCEVPVGPAEKHHVLHFDAIHHYLYNTRCQVAESAWLKQNTKTPVAMKVQTMRDYGLRAFQVDIPPYCVPKGTYATCGRVHGSADLVDPRAIYVPCSAWHLSSFGGKDMMLKKLQDNADNSHEVSVADVLKCQERNEDRHMALRPLPRAAATYPQVPHSLAENPEKFAVFLGRY